MGVDIKLGASCNNNCMFCAVGDDCRTCKPSFQEIKQKLISARSEHDLVVFTGGEVTIRNDFLSIVDFAKKLGYSEIQVQSNGRMFFYEDFCKKVIAAGVNQFALSLHGPNAEIHDSLTQSKGSFVQAVQGIKNLKRLGQRVLLNTVITKQNYAVLPEISKFILELDVDQYQFAFIHPCGNAEKNFDIVVPRYKEVSPYLHKALDIGMNAGRLIFAEATPHCILGEKYYSCSSEKMIPISIILEENRIIDNWDYARKNECKSKFSQCNQCVYTSECEGVWKEYAERFGGSEFVPILNRLEKNL